MKRIVRYSISFYQRYVSIVFGYGSCRYYPTCSEYAKWQIDNNTFLRAILYSFLRILRCNQLFKGGIEYPIVKKEFNHPFFMITNRQKYIKVRYWYIPKEKNLFYVIKKFKG